MRRPATAVVEGKDGALTAASFKLHKGLGKKIQDAASLAQKRAARILSIIQKADQADDVDELQVPDELERAIHGFDAAVADFSPIFKMTKSEECMDDGYEMTEEERRKKQEVGKRASAISKSLASLISIASAARESVSKMGDENELPSDVLRSISKMKGVADHIARSCPRIEKGSETPQFDKTIEKSDYGDALNRVITTAKRMQDDIDGLTADSEWPETFQVRNDRLAKMANKLAVKVDIFDDIAKSEKAETEDEPESEADDEEKKKPNPFPPKKKEDGEDVESGTKDEKQEDKDKKKDEDEKKEEAEKSEDPVLKMLKSIDDKIGKLGKRVEKLEKSESDSSAIEVEDEVTDDADGDAAWGASIGADWGDDIHGDRS